MAWTFLQTRVASNSGSAKTNYQHRIVGVGAASTVDVEAASGQAVVPIAATTNFAVGQIVILSEGQGEEETGEIQSVSAGVSITMTANLANTHAVSRTVINGDQHLLDNTQSAGVDLRITPSGDTSSLLDFWIKRWDQSGNTFEIWVEIPSIGGSGSTTVDVYYSGGAVSTVSDITTTFPIGEDFTDSSTALANIRGGPDNPTGIVLGNLTTQNTSLGASGAGWRQVAVKEQSQGVPALDATSNEWWLWISGEASDGDVDVGLVKVTLDSDKIISGIVVTGDSGVAISLAEDPYLMMDDDGQVCTHFGSKYWMAYERKAAGSPSSQSGIGIAYSSDGLSWTKVDSGTAVLTVGSGGSWDETAGSFGSPVFLHDETNALAVIYYEGASGANTQTGRATAPAADFNIGQTAADWTKYGSNPVSSGDVIDDVVKIGSTWYWTVHTIGGLQQLWTATGNPSDLTGFATSGYTPYQQAGNSVNYFFDSGGGILSLVSYGQGATDLHFMEMLGNSAKWTAQVEGSRGSSSNNVFVQEIWLDITNKYLELKPHVSASKNGVGIVSAVQSALTEGFRVLMFGRIVDQGTNDDLFSNFGLGGGDIGIHGTNNFYPLVDLGMLLTIYDPGLAGGTIMRRYTDAGDLTSPASGNLPLVDAEAQNLHWLGLYDASGNAQWNYDGADGALTLADNENPLKDATILTVEKRIFVSSGNNSNDGSIMRIEALAAAVWDGTDTTEGADGDIQAVSVANLPAAVAAATSGLRKLRGVGA